MELIKKMLPVKEAEGWYLTENAYRTFTEDFIDEETNEVSTIERREILVKKGAFLTKLDISMMEENGVSHVKVSNIPVIGDQEKYTNLWEIILKTHSQEGNKKKSFLVTADSPSSAESFISEWMEVNVQATFEIVKVTQVEYNKVIKIYDVEREEYESNRYHKIKWYKCLIYSMIEDEENETIRRAGSKNILIQATEFENAIAAVKWIMIQNEYDAYYKSFKLMQELTISEVFIPDENVTYYSDNEILL
jgi:DNA-directed RNA polymerase subunit beta